MKLIPDLLLDPYVQGLVELVADSVDLVLQFVPSPVEPCEPGHEKITYLSDALWVFRQLHVVRLDEWEDTAPGFLLGS